MHPALALGVETMLFSRHLMVINSAVLVDLSPGKLIRFPRTVQRTLYGLAFWGQYLAVIRMYVAFLPSGISSG
jgi:hypothetical protein